MPILCGRKVQKQHGEHELYELFCRHVFVDGWCYQLQRMSCEFELARFQHVGECVFVQRGVLFRERQWLSELCGWKIRDTRRFLVWLSGKLFSHGKRHLCDLRSGQVQESDSRHELHVLRCRDVHARGRRYGLSVVYCKRGRGHSEGRMPV